MARPSGRLTNDETEVRTAEAERIARRHAHGPPAGDVGHVSAVIAMMAAWDLSSLPLELPRLAELGTALHLVAAGRDAAVPPQQAQALAARVPGATLHGLPGLGHLAHEEAPREVAAAIEPLLPR